MPVKNVLFLLFYIDYNFCHVILYIRVHVIRYPVETAAHVSRCTRIAATLVSVFRTLKANIVRKYVYNGRHFGGMTLTLLGPTGKTTCSSTTLVTAIQRIRTVLDAFPGQWWKTLLRCLQLTRKTPLTNGVSTPAMMLLMQSGAHSMITSSPMIRTC